MTYKDLVSKHFSTNVSIKFFSFFYFRKVTFCKKQETQRTKLYSYTYARNLNNHKIIKTRKVVIMIQ